MSSRHDNREVRYEMWMGVGLSASFSFHPLRIRCLWSVNWQYRRHECQTGVEVEPLVRAWFLGDCIPGIVADFIEERGEGEEWLLRLLRDDPDWHASVPNVATQKGGWVTAASPEQIDVVRLRELAERYSLREPLTDWTYRPSDMHRWITSASLPTPQGFSGSGPVVVSGTTE